MVRANRIRAFACFLPAGIIVSACSLIPGTNANKIKYAEKAVRDEALDPSAVLFRNEELSKDHSYVCGEMNGKNRMGAYVGFTRFVSYVNFPVAFIDNDVTQEDVNSASCPASGECPDQKEKINQLVENQEVKEKWAKGCA